MHSARYQIQQAFFGVVQGIAAARQAKALYNPALPAGLSASAPRLMFVADRGDNLMEQPNQRERRRTQLLVGVLVRSEAGDDDADELHFATRLAIRHQVREQLLVAGINAPVLREIEIDPGVVAFQTDGALLMSMWQVEYQQPYPPAA